MLSTTSLDESLFDDAATEHITLTADEPDDAIEQDCSSATERTFVQTLTARDEVRQFSIADGYFLTVNTKLPRQACQQYQFNLAFLNPNPRRFSGVAWRWLYAGLGLVGLSVMAFGISLYSELPLLKQSWLPVNVLLVVATIITFLIFVYRTRFTLTFYSRHGKVPLVELAARSPGSSEVERFVTELQKDIASAHDIHWHTRQQFLRDELRLHFRLWEEGVLADDIYEASKVRILREHD